MLIMLVSHERHRRLWSVWSAPSVVLLLRFMNHCELYSYSIGQQL